jgi:acyl-CoA thioester hydrolase
MYTFEFPYRVTYADTDKMGYLYYGNYARLYEIGRVETLRNLGCRYKDLEDMHNIMLPVVASESRYIAPAVYDELLILKTSIAELPQKMIVFNNEIFNEAGKLIHKAQVKLFFIDMDTQARISCPDWLQNKLKPYF